jgi:hypothetical protein
LARRPTLARLAAFLVGLVPAAPAAGTGDSVCEPVSLDLLVRLFASALAWGGRSVVSTGVPPREDDLDLVWLGELRGFGGETVSVSADFGETRLDAIAVTPTVQRDQKQNKPLSNPTASISGTLTPQQPNDIRESR